MSCRIWSLEPQNNTPPPVISSEVFIQTDTFLSLSYAEPSLLHCRLYRVFFVSSSSSCPYISNSHVFADCELCKGLQSDGPLVFWGRCNSITILILLSCCSQPCRLRVLTCVGLCTVPSQKFFFPTSHSKNRNHPLCWAEVCVTIYKLKFHI